MYYKSGDYTGAWAEVTNTPTMKYLHACWDNTIWALDLNGNAYIKTGGTY